MIKLIKRTERESNVNSRMSPINAPNHTSSSAIIPITDEEVFYMTNQDKRAVESLCQCGLDLDSIIESFPKMDPKEVEEIYRIVKGIAVIDVPVLKVNCS